MGRQLFVRFGPYYGHPVQNWLNDKDQVFEDISNIKWYDNFHLYVRYVEIALSKYPDLIDPLFERLPSYARKRIPVQFQPGTQSFTLGKSIVPDKPSENRIIQRFRHSYNQHFETEELDAHRFDGYETIENESEDDEYNVMKTTNKRKRVIVEESESEDDQEEETETYKRQRTIVQESEDENEEESDEDDEDEEEQIINKKSIKKETTYYVEHIIDFRYNAKTKTIEYLVKWQDYDHDENTWETAKSFHHHKIVTDFWKGMDKLKSDNDV